MPGLRTRLITVAIISLFLLSLNPGSPLLPTIPRVHAATTIWLRATYPTWNNTNPPITVTPGDSITMQLSNPDMFMHRFVVDVDNSPPTSTPNCSVEKCSPFFSSPITYPFIVDFPSGPYKYYCSVHFTVMVGTFTVQPPDFTISASASTPASIVAGSSATSTITLTSQNGFAGSVNLAASTTAPVTGLTFSFSMNPVTLTAGGTGTSTLTISTTASTPPGTYTITVTGTGMGGSPSRSATTAVTVVGPDFSISSGPTTLTIVQGSSGNSTITLTSLNGFTGSVTLGVAVSPTGPTASINPSSVSLSSGAGTAMLTVSTSTGAYSSTATGSYTLTITGTSGSLSHPATVSVTVTSSNSSPFGVGNIPASVLIGVIAAAVAVIVVAVILVRRRPKT